MSKVLLLIVVLWSLGAPILLAGRPAPKRNLRLVQITSVLVVFLWAYLALTVYPQIVKAD